MIHYIEIYKTTCIALAVRDNNPKELPWDTFNPDDYSWEEREPMAYWWTLLSVFDASAPPVFAEAFNLENKDNYQHGRITSILPEMFPDLSGYAIYIAGSTEFVKDCTMAVKKLGANEKRVHVEGFFEQGIE